MRPLANDVKWEYKGALKISGAGSVPLPYPSHRQQRFIVRLPDGMRDRVAEAAKRNNRSMNAEVVSRLERSFETPPDEADVRSELAAARLLRMTPKGDPHEVRLAQLERRVQELEVKLSK